MSKFKIFNEKSIKKGRTGTINGVCKIDDVLEVLQDTDKIALYAWTNGECKKHPMGCPVTSIDITPSKDLIVKFHGSSYDGFTVQSIRDKKFKGLRLRMIMSGASHPYHQGWVLDHIKIEHGKKNWNVTFMPGQKIER